ncbi:MAG: hypothetical protein H3C62_01010 [Gemmatimonadaceae bacterium]|nr:hypothetical protein [Gemmatimonadaceae bacterium]
MTTFSNAATAVDSCPFCGPVTVSVDRMTGIAVAVTAAGVRCRHTFEQRQAQLQKELFGEVRALSRRSVRGPRMRPTPAPVVR